ncbi:hypothetical protein VH569_13170 [Azospirillum sp. 11R-A]|uniref:hypothetical protein n=1 Tax=Azospirillum sp. 11R-A TaxID=3111634 RepID=UPI003C22F301
MVRVLIHPVLSPVKVAGRKLMPGDLIAAGHVLPDDDVDELVKRSVIGPAEERDFDEGDPLLLFPVDDAPADPLNETVAGPTGHPAGTDGSGGVAAAAAPTPTPPVDVQPAAKPAGRAGRGRGAS